MEKDNTYENSNIEVTETSRLEAENIMETSAGELVASQKAQNPGVLYIQMLGGFSMTYQGQPILLGKSLSSKMLHLLMLLIYSRGEGIRRIRLLEQLYGDSDTEQAANSLRAMIFRLRKSLVAAGLPDGEYISTRGGIIYVDSGSCRCRAGRGGVPEAGYGSHGREGCQKEGYTSGGGLRTL